MWYRAQRCEQIPILFSSSCGCPFFVHFRRWVRTTIDNWNGHRVAFASSLFRGLRPFTSLFSNDIAIDLGTVNTRVYVRGRGIVIIEPSAVAVNTVTGELEALGKEAWEMIGRTPSSIVVGRPLKNGVIADFKLAQAMLVYFIRKAHSRTTLVHPRIVISIPSEITEVERRAVTESAYRAKASEVHLVEQVMLAAIGAGMPIAEPVGNMIVDIGGGTTDVAVISLNGIVYSRSLRVAGKQMDEAIAEYVKRKHNLIIGERTTERVKIEIGSASPLDEPRTTEAKGRDLINNVPKSVVLDDSEIRGALNECVSTIIAAIRAALERTPPELAGDIGERGMVLTGGGALLRNLDRCVREQTGLAVAIADDPICCVARGAGKMLEDFALLKRVAVV
jgi:rod shape-determining protein MreB